MRGLEDDLGVSTEFSAQPASRRELAGFCFRRVTTDLCQCFTMASVESMRVPSMSNRRPPKEWISAAPVKEPVVEDILSGPVKSGGLRQKPSQSEVIYS